MEFKEFITQAVALRKRLTLIYASPESKLLAIDEYIKNYNAHSLKESLSIIPSFFHRQWIRACAHGHLRMLKRARRGLAENDPSLFLKNLHLSFLWIEQSKRLFSITKFLLSLKDKDLKTFHIDPIYLKKGDVILSYKTSGYLRHEPLSRLVKVATNSAVTHAMIVCNDPGQKPEVLASSDETHGLGVLSVSPAQGEIFLVMRLKQSLPLNTLIESIDAWRVKARMRDNYVNNRKTDAWQFPELKCQLASGIGLLYVLFGYLGKSISIPNPGAKRTGVFCSELIDPIFKEARMMLVARSEHDAVIGPVEILYSPLLTIVGFIARQEDAREAKQEIALQFNDRLSQRKNSSSL